MATGYAFHQQTQQGMNVGVKYKLPPFATLNNNLLVQSNALNWTQISIKNPIRHWAQGSYKIANVE
jgi:hypothetical protein